MGMANHLRHSEHAHNIVNKMEYYSALQRSYNAASPDAMRMCKQCYCGFVGTSNEL